MSAFRDALGKRLLALLVLGPGVAFFYFGFAWSAWWFIAAVGYPFAVMAVLWILVPEEGGGTADADA